MLLDKTWPVAGVVLSVMGQSHTRECEQWITTDLGQVLETVSWPRYCRHWLQRAPRKINCASYEVIILSAALKSSPALWALTEKTEWAQRSIWRLYTLQISLQVKNEPEQDPDIAFQTYKKNMGWVVYHFIKCEHGSIVVENTVLSCRVLESERRLSHYNLLLRQHCCALCEGL